MDWSAIGEGDKPCQNPPELGREDLFIWNWYFSNSTGFVRDFNLMPSLINRLNMDEENLRIFLAKLNLIHQTALKIQSEEAEKAIRKVK